MNSKELCAEVSSAICNGYSSPSGYGGIGMDGEREIEQRLCEFVDAIKKETMREVQQFLNNLHLTNQG